MKKFLKISLMVLFSHCFYQDISIALDTEDSSISASRKFFQSKLSDLKEGIKEEFPTLFISYSWDNEAHTTLVDTLRLDLEGFGFPVEYDLTKNRPGGPNNLHKHTDKIETIDKVLLVGSPGLKTKYANAEEGKGGMISQEIDILRTRINKVGLKGIIPLLFQGGMNENFPGVLHHLPTRYLMTGSAYFINFFELLIDIFHTEENGKVIVQQIEEAQKGFEKLSKISPSILRAYVRQQREEAEAEAEKDDEARKAILGLDKKDPSKKN